MSKATTTTYIMRSRVLKAGAIRETNMLFAGKGAATEISDMEVDRRIAGGTLFINPLGLPPTALLAAAKAGLRDITKYARLVSDAGGDVRNLSA